MSITRLIFGFVLGFLLSWISVLCLPHARLLGIDLSQFEFPILRISGFSTSEARGEIVVGQRVLSRVQVYDANGDFLEGFFLRDRASKFQIVRLDDGGFVDCGSANGGRSDLYDVQGEFIATVKNALSETVCLASFPYPSEALLPRSFQGEIIAAKNQLVTGQVIGGTSTAKPLISTKVSGMLIAVFFHPILAGLAGAFVLGLFGILGVRTDPY